MNAQDHARDASGSSQTGQRVPVEDYYESKFGKYDSIARLFPTPEDANQYLDALTDVAEVLGIDDVSFPSYSSALARLSAEELSAKQSVLRLARTKDELAAHLASAQHEQRLIQTWAAPPASTAPALERQKAVLATKAREYQAELDALTAALPAAPPATVSALAAQLAQLRHTARRLRAQRARVRAFQGLPPNLERARHELRAARDTHMQLVQLRERLLERMAGGVS